MKNGARRHAVCRLQHQEPTSDEVGMKNGASRNAVCRLQHQEPTSDEVGMLRPRVPVGYNPYAHRPQAGQALERGIG